MRGYIAVILNLENGSYFLYNGKSERGDTYAKKNIRNSGSRWKSRYCK